MDYIEIREMYHHGIKGQRWGVRKYQNEDGSLTAEGKVRYSKESSGNKKDNTTGKAIGLGVGSSALTLGATLAATYGALKIWEKTDIFSKKADVIGSVVDASPYIATILPLTVGAAVATTVAVKSKQKNSKEEL